MTKTPTEAQGTGTLRHPTAAQIEEMRDLLVHAHDQFVAVILEAQTALSVIDTTLIECGLQPIGETQHPRRRTRAKN